MSDPSYEARLRQALDLVRQHGSVSAAARASGIPRGTLSEQYHRARERGLMLNGPAPALPEAPAVAEIDVLRQRVREMEAAMAQLRKQAISAEAVRQEILGLAAYRPARVKWLGTTAMSPSDPPGVPSLMLSDLHWAEKVDPAQVFGLNTYNLEIARRRLHYTVEKACRILTSYISPARYPGIVLELGGDMVSGSIHPELEETNEVPIMAAITDMVEHGVRVIERLLEDFERVHVVGVPGNHGRTTRKPRAKFYAETNADWLIYQMIEMVFKHHSHGARVTFDFPPARDITFEIAGRRFRLTHGDQFRGGDGIIGAVGPIIRGDKKKRSSALTMPGHPELYDTLLVGHFHQFDFNPRRIVNGSLKGFDEYSLAENFDFEPPMQACWVTHPRWGINYAIPLIADPVWQGTGGDPLAPFGKKEAA